jgi:hypothetical protein
MKVDPNKLRAAMTPESSEERRQLDTRQATITVALQKIATFTSCGKKFGVFEIDNRGNPINELITFS